MSGPSGTRSAISSTSGRRLSKQPDDVIARDIAVLRDEDRMTPELAFRDPYFLDFLGLTAPYVEKDMEQAILRELEAFILEWDRLRLRRPAEAYHPSTMRIITWTCCSTTAGLRRLVAIELTSARFQAGDKGQMELYLRWLEKYEVRPNEEPPLGLILFADKSEEHVELLQRTGAASGSRST